MSRARSVISAAAALMAALLSLPAHARSAPAAEAQAAAAKPAPPAVVLIKGGTVWTMGKGGILPKGDVLIRDGKIAKVAETIDPPSGALVIDAAGRHVT